MRGAHVERRFERRDPRAIHEAVERVVRGKRRVDRVLVTANVDAQRLARNLAGQRVERGHVAPRRDDLRARPRQRDRARAPDPARRARDEHPRTAEIESTFHDGMCNPCMIGSSAGYSAV